MVILPVPVEQFACGDLEFIPGTHDVIGDTVAMDQSQRAPDRGIAPQDEASPGTTQDGCHAAPVRFNTGGVGIVPVALVQGTPETGVQFEICAAPFLVHDLENTGEMFLNPWMGAVKHVPGSTTPASIADLLGTDRFPVLPSDEPIRMIPEEL